MAKEGSNVRERLTRERDRLIRRLQDLGLSPQSADDGGAPGDDARSPRDEGDQAQASEREDLGVLTRERLAARINQLSAALGPGASSASVWKPCRRRPRASPASASGSAARRSRPPYDRRAMPGAARYTLLALCFSCLWASGFVPMKIALRDAPPCMLRWASR